MSEEKDESVWTDHDSTLRHPNGRFVRGLTEYEARERMRVHAFDPPPPPPELDDPDRGFAFVGDALDPTPPDE